MPHVLINLNYYTPARAAVVLTVLCLLFHPWTPVGYVSRMGDVAPANKVKISVLLPDKESTLLGKTRFFVDSAKCECLADGGKEHSMKNTYAQQIRAKILIKTFCLETFILLLEQQLKRNSLIGDRDLKTTVIDHPAAVYNYVKSTISFTILMYTLKKWNKILRLCIYLR